MYCKTCGAQNPDGAQFCSSCGGDLRSSSPAQPGPGPQQHTTPQPAQAQNNAATTGLILGIISIVFVWIPNVSWVSLITSILGLVLGSKKRTGPSAGTAGRVLNTIALVLWIISIILVAAIGSFMFF